MTTTAPALIDILSLIQQHASIQLSGRPTNSKSGREYHSNCPWCGGTDRFAIWPEQGRYSCSIRSSGCGKSGDAIQFLRDFCDMTYAQACQELDIDPRYPEEHKAALLPLTMTSNEPPNKQWQESAEMFVRRAQRYLWTPGGARGLQYLHSRGFTDDTLKAARIGFVPDWYSEELEAWGLASNQTEEELIKIPEGIILPWIVDNCIWKISVRRPDQSYFQVLGSSDCLYNIDSLQPNLPVFLFEGEFDALSIYQTSANIAACIATGSASKGRTSPLVARLKKASHVLVAFDQDEAGHAGAQEWLKLLKNSVRWQPWSHDANDMLKSGMPVRLWAEMGIKAATIELQAPEKPQTEQPHIDTPVVLAPSKPHRDAIRTYVELNPWTTLGDRGLPKFCSVCRKEQAVWWGAAITPFCATCWAKKS